MAKLNEIANYVNIASAPPSEVPNIIGYAKKQFSEHFDTKNVIFVPTRDHESGWQFPNDEKR